MNLTRNEKILAVALLATIVVSSAIILTTTWRISNIGRIKAIGVSIYWNQEATEECIFINWGDLNAGDRAYTTLYAKNHENTPFTMSLNSSNWQPPEAGQHLTISWDYTGHVVNPQEVVAFDLMLSVNTNITDVYMFSFDIDITAEEVQS